MDGISKALNTSFEQDQVEAPKKVSTISKHVKPVDEEGRVVLENKEYLKLQLMISIENTQNTIRMIEEQLARPPISIGLVKSLAEMNMSLHGYIMALSKIDFDAANVELAQKKIDSIDRRSNVGSTTNNVIFLDSKSLDKMLEDAKSSSKLKAIDADFEVDNIK